MTLDEFVGDCVTDSVVDRVARIAAELAALSGDTAYPAAMLSCCEPAYVALSRHPDVRLRTFVYGGEEPYALDDATVRVGRVEISATRKRAATAEELQRMESEGHDPSPGLRGASWDVPANGGGQ